MQCPEGHPVPRFLTPDEVFLIHRLLPETTESSYVPGFVILAPAVPLAATLYILGRR